MRNDLGLTILMVAGCLVAFWQTCTGAEQVFYVAPDGDDQWSGRFDSPLADKSDGPLATLEGARQRIRQLKGGEGKLSEGVRVLIRGGVYRLEHPFVLTPEDSGSWDAPICYAAYPGERPVFSGGRIITNWQVEGGRWVAELPQVKTGEWQFSALWVNGEHLRPARTPNDGFFTTAGKVGKVTDPTTGQELDCEKSGFIYREGEIKPWSDLENALVVVYHSWDVSYSRIAELDETNRIVTFKKPVTWAFEYWGPNQRYFVENVYEALDAPGEWYLDRSKGLLYYIPRPGEKPETVEVVAPVVRNIVRLEGKPEEGRYVQYIRFEGLSFQHTDYSISTDGMPDEQAAYSVDAAIQAEGALHCVFHQCEVSRTSNYGVWFDQGCRYNRLIQNHIHDLGAGGVRLGNGASPSNEQMETSWNVVDNNWIHDGGKVFPAGVGVWIGRSSYNTVSHNDISDFYYTGVSVGWSWGYAPSSANHNIIEYNHIHHIGKGLLSDMGGVYLLGIAPGTLVRNNLIHDIYSFTYGGWGIYPDEGSSDLLIENNVVYNTKTGGFHQHYGKENRVRNNIFAFALEGQVQRSREEDHISFFFERNIVYYDQGVLLSSTWKNGKFAMDYNCYWNTEDPEIDFAGRSFEEWRAEGHDQNSIIADPLFRDATQFDFRLNPMSPVFQLGFRPIDVSNVGLYGSEEWTSLPGQVLRTGEDFFVRKVVQEIRDDFEDTEVGSGPQHAQTLGETDVAQIRVTNETAASGSRCLKFVDAPGLDHPYNPHLLYTPNWSRGVVREQFSLRVEQGAQVVHEWRSAGHPYKVGPSLTIGEDGTLTVAGNQVAQLNHGGWYVFEISCGLGRQATGTFRFQVKDKSGAVVAEGEPPLPNPRFRFLGWVGFIANADAAAVFYLDDFHLVVE